jgi:hypothetical protein
MLTAGKAARIRRFAWMIFLIVRLELEFSEETGLPNTSTILYFAFKWSFPVVLFLVVVPKALFPQVAFPANSVTSSHSTGVW